MILQYTAMYQYIPLCTYLYHWSLSWAIIMYSYKCSMYTYREPCSMHNLPVSSNIRNPQDRDQWYKKVCTGMYEKGLSCTITWYILGCTEYAHVCTKYVHVYTYMYLTETFHCGEWKVPVKSPSEKSQESMYSLETILSQLSSIVTPRSCGVRTSSTAKGSHWWRPHDLWLCGKGCLNAWKQWCLI